MKRTIVLEVFDFKIKTYTWRHNKMGNVFFALFSKYKDYVVYNTLTDSL